MSNVVKFEQPDCPQLRQRIRVLESALSAAIRLGQVLAVAENPPEALRSRAYQEFEVLKRAIQ